MGRTVYLATSTYHKNQPNIGKYTIVPWIQWDISSDHKFNTQKDPQRTFEITGNPRLSRVKSKLPTKESRNLKLTYHLLKKITRISEEIPNLETIIFR